MDNSKDIWEAKLQKAFETRQEIHINMDDGVGLDGRVTKIGENYIEFTYKENKTYRSKNTTIVLAHIVRIRNP